MNNFPSKTKSKTIGITLGDPGGIGPEVTAKSLRQPAVRKLAQFKIIGDEIIYRRYFSGRYPHCVLLDQGNKLPRNFKIGKASSAGARLSLTYLNKAIELLKKGELTALVTAPVCKETICSLGVKFPGHTEYLAQAFGARKFGMMFVSDRLKTILVTRHIPLAQVSRSLSIGKILETIVLVHQTLHENFKVKNPRIAVCGLNPHAGEGGKIGREEQRLILPAIHKAQRLGIQTEGPFPADTIFYPPLAGRFAAIVAMYHDQGIIAVKTLSFTSLVNLTVGLPFIRTSPAHGTAFALAGKNLADCSSMTEALKLAAQLA